MLTWPGACVSPRSSGRAQLQARPHLGIAALLWVAGLALAVGPTWQPPSLAHALCCSGGAGTTGPRAGNLRRSALLSAQLSGSANASIFQLFFFFFFFLAP